MLKRFSLYGFLKNQKYFEPFLILFLRDKGLSFLAIGALIAFREISINIMEIPSGAIADIFGRRRSMILSFCAYIASFITFGLSRSMPLLFAAMFLFAVGEAFRTGTHKAMIFTWLRSLGRESERAQIYGYTRSWSKLGSALSVLIAAAIVIASRSYDYIFYIAVIPYVIGIINFLGYPRFLDGAPESRPSLAAVARHLGATIGDSFRKPALRRLMLESMGFEGIFNAASPYLQPILQAVAITWLANTAFAPNLGLEGNTALIAGPVYFVLYLLSAVASRRAHTLAAAAGGETRAINILWAAAFAIYLVLIPFLGLHIQAPAIAAFIVLYTMQNTWRPLQIARFDTHSTEQQGATILSIESQAKSIATMIAAPLLGWAVDHINTPGAPATNFWPVAATGAAISLLVLITALKREAWYQRT